MNTMTLPRAFPSFERDESEATRSLRGEFGASAEPRRPSVLNIPSDVSVIERVTVEEDVKILSKLSRRISNTTSEIDSRVGVQRLLLGKTLLPSFTPSLPIVKRYAEIYNGTGIRRIVRRLSGAHLTVSEIGELLSAIVEDALLGVASYLRTSEQSITRVRAEDEYILESAIAERLPRVYEENGHRLASQIVSDLKKTLGSSRILAIDDGAVILHDKEIRIIDAGTSPVILSRTSHSKEIE